MAKAETNVKVLNAIREAASDSYKAKVPVANLNNLTDVGNPILEYQSVRNEFLELLVNKIALPVVRARMFRNPLAMLRREGSPLGTDEEEIGVNPAKAEKFNAHATDLLAQHTPDVKVAYHRMNRQERYFCTIQYAVLRGGFTSWGGFDRLTDEVVESLYNGNYIDEFSYTKELLGNSATTNPAKMATIHVPFPSDETKARAFVRAARGAFSSFLFPSTKYNSWALMGGAGADYTSWSNAEDIMIAIRSDVLATVDVDVLARAFNLDKTDFLGRVINVPDFGESDGAQDIIAVMFDKNYPVIVNKLFTVENFVNGSNLSTNYYLHVWQTYSTSPLENAVAFIGDTNLSNLTVAPTAADFDFWGTTCSDIQTGVSVSAGAITGTLAYQSTGQIVTDWGEGYFLGVTLSNIDTDATSVKIGLDPSEGSGLVEILTDPDKTALLKITDKNTQKLVIIQSNSTGTHKQTFDLSGLTLTPPTENRTTKK